MIYYAVEVSLMDTRSASSRSRRVVMLVSKVGREAVAGNKVTVVLVHRVLVVWML